MMPHQQRVIDERRELGDKIGKLGVFLAAPLFSALDAAEQRRLTAQHAIMQRYADILDERIHAFDVEGTSAK